MAVGTVTMSVAGVGGAQSGTITTGAGTGAGVVMVCNDTDSPITYNVATAGTDVQTGLKLDAKAFTRITGLNNGAQTLTSVKTAHGTAAQNGEIVYITLASA